VAAALLGLGVRELSMVPGALGEVTDLLHLHDLAALRAVADEARHANGGAEARAIRARLT
jgi:signal transduction protein with GAF and PtsI domain